jgi:hypothetical protein
LAMAEWAMFDAPAGGAWRLFCATAAVIEACVFMENACLRGLLSM